LAVYRVRVPVAATDPGMTHRDASTATPDGHRLAWLDALRGIAALLVVYEHLTHFLFNRYRLGIEHWFLAGYAGVCLFFIVSGYIIPASLERRGSLRGFWISRVFRLYPLLAFVLAVLVALHLAGLRQLDPHPLRHPLTSAAAHATMLPALLGVPDVLGVTWTLAFEMAFYLLVAALFAVGLRRASPVVALVLCGTALAMGGDMPVLALSHSALGARYVLMLGVAVFALAIAAMLSGRPRLALAGAVLGGLLSVSLLLGNQNAGHRWDGLLIPALMFTGTTVYRVERRQIRWWWAVVVPLAVGTVWVVQGYRELAGYPPAFHRLVHPLLPTLAVVAALFVTGMALRRRRIPRVLAWLGLVSYSVYLLHLVVLETVERLLGAGTGPSTAPGYVQLALATGLVGLVLAASWLTYRLIEAPAQRLGRRVTRWLDGRAPVPASAAVPLGVAREPGDLVRLQ
jgi:peptidoglycan/LPS O-acetylase OafA/YrhL